ncbi:Thioredoxin domain-containing protein/TPR_8 domain-containing protein/TPR_11 domain-containing protein [Cephalotus follicularis]|uniref:Thioredoxin domain-containing protein/TPR_8 domain-containing protein/TPR_11 domain-containing protein n=1 Tax=Cephalotus follicularis TaxID=3775 RepID=A0A1Q3AWX7_CEPFO|nr:Thioredoxin domain-containing protein/TPR_8 domain-containing protein/TPR_11 domain-containing protein [Cephalotus follicularis]
MSFSSKNPTQEANFDSLTKRLHDSLSFNDNNNKPDSKEVDLDSPISPLVTRSAINNCIGVITPSSSSSSSASVSSKTNNNNTQLSKRPENGSKNHSGELSVSSESIPATPGSVPTIQNPKPGHRRSVSAGSPLIYSGSSFCGSNNGCCVNNGESVSSNPTTTNLLPSGNICPSGKILKAGLGPRVTNRTDTLGTGMGHYGHGSIIRGNGSKSVSKISSVDGNAKGCVNGCGGDAEEVKRAGNEMYRRGNFVEALALYDKAILMSPENAAYRSNKAAALTAMGRLGEAVRECEEAARLDPGFGRAHQRLASLYLRLGQAENGKRHLCFPGQHPDPVELQKLQFLEKHLNRCADSRKIGDWKSVLRETDAAIAVGADSSPQLVACKAEALLKLHQIDDANSILSRIPKFEHNPSSARAKFCCMVIEAYVLYVRAQVEMTMGRFENAVSVAEKASLIDYSNVEIATVLNNVKTVARARIHGNDLFSTGRYAEACSAYGEGLKHDNSNSILYCNRAVCWSKLGIWEKSVEDCNNALRIQPNYTKALLRRAVSNGKLGRWVEAVRDYEVLRRELPGDDEVVESLQRAQVALNKSRGQEYNTMKLGGEVEEISSLEKFKAAILSTGVSVVHFKVSSNEQCEEISPFINMLCVRYPTVHFFKVDVEEILAVAKAESIRSVPTFKIYKNGNKVEEMIHPSHQFLEDAVRTCSL